MDDIDSEIVREADEAERALIWSRWVTRYGPEEASRRWLAIFAATDAPKTG